MHSQHPPPLCYCSDPPFGLLLFANEFILGFRAMPGSTRGRRGVGIKPGAPAPALCSVSLAPVLFVISTGLGASGEPCALFMVGLGVGRLGSWSAVGL